MAETGIYALALNGTRAWINQDDEQNEPYGKITGQYSNKAYKVFQQALKVYAQDKEQAAKMLEPYFEAVTRKF